MTRTRSLVAAAAMLIIFPLLAAENPKFLLGSWTGKATGPQGGPPTGDLLIVFEKAGQTIKGAVTVKGAGGLQYSGELSSVTLKGGIFSANAVFKLGETPLEAQVRGPLKDRTIQGTFTVISKGEKMGEGTFSIAKSPGK
jgi:hypothetical protein